MGVSFMGVSFMGWYVWVGMFCVGWFFGCVGFWVVWVGWWVVLSALECVE